MNIRLSIVITIVSGAESLRRCLSAIMNQIDRQTEVIVPYDAGSIEIESLKGEFQEVTFLFDDDADVKLRQHDLYDRRRARGLAAAQGTIIAMTEDHAVPAENWVRQIIAAHERPFAVIGGVIDNSVDRPINWALYYCDFGRYGNPLQAGTAEYVSDVNLSYKRQALMAVSEIWRSGYHETSVHWALRARGEELYLDPRLVVYQQRPAIGFGQAYRERIEWGAVFAETRTSLMSRFRRYAFAAGTVFLPFLLTGRVIGHMRRQRRTMQEMLRIIPIVFVLFTGWALGEMIGYIAGGATTQDSEQSSARHPDTVADRVADTIYEGNRR